MQQLPTAIPSLSHLTIEPLPKPSNANTGVKEAGQPCAAAAAPVLSGAIPH